MSFTFKIVDQNIDVFDVASCTTKFADLLFDLSVSTYNTLVGSQLGGNDQQLFFLLNCEHKLQKNKYFIDLDLDHSCIYWDITFLRDSSLSEIRNKLNEAMEDLSADESLSAKLLATNFRNIENLVNEQLSFTDSSHENIASLQDYSLHNQVIVASCICAWLSKQLDSGNDPKIDKVVSLLEEVQPVVLLASIRKHVGIARIIKHNLDMNYSPFARLINKVNIAAKNLLNLFP
jgi:hypothetical protein